MVVKLSKVEFSAHVEPGQQVAVSRVHVIRTYCVYVCRATAVGDVTDCRLHGFHVGREEPGGGSALKEKQIPEALNDCLDSGVLWPDGVSLTVQVKNVGKSPRTFTIEFDCVLIDD